MVARNYSKPAGRLGRGGHVLKMAKAKNVSSDAAWTDGQRELFSKAALKVKSIDVARQELDVLGDDLCILFLEMTEAKIPKGSICELYGISNNTLNNMIVQGDSMRALRAVEGR